MKSFLLFCSLVGLGWSARAAIAAPSLELIGRGKVIGGEAGKGFSLLKVSRSPLKSGERWVLSLGNERGEVKKGKPGYYHVELDSEKRKINIDLSQLQLSKVSEDQLRQIVSSSQFIAAPKMRKDPLDQTLNLEFDLKKNPRVRVYQVAGVKGTSRIVIDLK